MGIEIRVHCEYPKCEETEIAVAHDDKYGAAGLIVDELADHRFHFVAETEWTDGPDGWTLSSDGVMLCPTHRPIETSSQPKTQ
ncbi:MAG: hypothetical protein ACRDPE_15270 [Solirubrobacterales bacterium]